MNKPIISIIVAMAKNRVIGKGNEMPWHLPADLKYFKEKTLGKPIIMGRKTYESIGRALPGRQNIVISSKQGYSLDGCDTATSLDDALSLVSDADEVMIIGGGYLYSLAIEKANKLYLTFIDLDVEGDTYFPEYEHLNIKEVNRITCKADEKNVHDYAFTEFNIS